MAMSEPHGVFDLLGAVGGPVSTIIPLGDSSRVGEARRAAALLAARTTMDETQTGRLAVLVTELGTNLVRYAREGSIALRLLQRHGAGHPEGVEIISYDRGPGISDLAHALRDGYSTGGTPGRGLGAVVRMADEFDIHSIRDVGTTIVARVSADAARGVAASDARLDVGIVCAAIDGGTVCGDGWAIRSERGMTCALLVDGLGHGPEAAAAADAALRLFDTQRSLEPAAFLRAAHAALRATRGAATAMAVLDDAAVRFAGVGNISATIVRADRSAKTLVSSNGIIGHNVHKTQDFTYEWTPDATLVMHTDGLSAKWRVEQYPGLATRHPSLLAATLYRDFARPRDDSTVLVLKRTAPRGRAT